jgi:hypothetical protein
VGEGEGSHGVPVLEPLDMPADGDGLLSELDGLISPIILTTSPIGD